MEPGCLRHPRAKILSQSRCACAFGAGCGTGPSALAVAAHRRRGGSRGAGRERRRFKYGSGSGSNFSKIRGEGEALSGGGRSSGLMSFLRIGDRAAGAIKSGGTTRRAAKMVIVDIDHPDIETFIDWKVVEEQKVAALVAGSKLAARHLNMIMTACREPAPAEAGGTDPGP